MKKLIALLLALVMVLGLAACGNTTAPETTPAARRLEGPPGGRQLQLSYGKLQHAQLSMGAPSVTVFAGLHICRSRVTLQHYRPPHTPQRQHRPPLLPPKL